MNAEFSYKLIWARLIVGPDLPQGCPLKEKSLESPQTLMSERLAATN
jgi:hypothetical protein